MKLSIKPVEVSYVSQIWDTVEPFLVESINKSEGAADYNISHVQMYATSGTWVLLVAVDEQNVIHGAMTVSFLNYPLNRVAFITTTGGKFIIDQDTFSQLSAIVKGYGATKIQALCRDSMVRLLQKQGFEPRTTLVEAKL
jgi:hypothetical protein